MMSPRVRPFDECEAYTQEDAAGLAFRKVLAAGIIPHLDMGLVTAEGPTHKFPGTHDAFDQVYLIFRGKGYAYLNGQRARIERPSIVIIPRGTEHSIEIDAGEVMQYVYVNHHASTERPGETDGL